MNFAGNWNSTGPFNSALKLHAAGYMDYWGGYLYSRGEYGYYWSSSQNDLYTGGLFSFGSGFTYPSTFYKNEGSSIRCLRNINVTVTTSEVTGISNTDATGAGEVINDGGSVVTARGVCWSTASVPTIANDHTSDGDGTGMFVSNISGLSPNTQYFVRAYATNDFGTTYGNEVTFTTMGFVCGTSFTIHHLPGDVAPVDKTVTYGTIDGITGEPSKCWITRNLGAGQVALAPNDASEASAGWYWQFGLKQGYQVSDLGARTPNTQWNSWPNITSDWQTENDPCTLELGSGWRIPTSSEWNNVNVTGNWTDWTGPWTSGLNLHAAGLLSYEFGGALNNRGTDGGYWSSTRNIDGYCWYLLFGSGYSNMYDYQPGFGFPLRCLR